MLVDEADDYSRILALINELSAQVNSNRAVAASLQAQVGQLKSQSAQQGSGFAVRRFHVDISKESFESEIERATAAAVIENQSLQRENKQLSSLLQEYEETLQTVMSKFHSHSRAAQLHEHTLTRHYETLLAARESQGTSSQDITSSPTIMFSLNRLAHLLKLALRTMDGEDVSDFGVDGPEITENDVASALASLSEREDWAVERESEISRLEKENEELRKMLGITPGSYPEEEEDHTPMLHSPRMQSSGLMGSSLRRQPLFTTHRPNGPPPPARPNGPSNGPSSAVVQSLMSVMQWNRERRLSANSESALEL